MLAHLEPSEEVTGGKFYSEGEMDLPLIETLADFVVKHVEVSSWAEQKQPPPNSKKAGLKRKRGADGGGGGGGGVVPAQQVVHNDKSALLVQDVEIDPPRYKAPVSHKNKPLIPFPANWPHYPTPASVLSFIRDQGLLNNSLNLAEKDMKDLMDMLVFDGRLERMGAEGYRTVRRVFDDQDEGKGNGYTEAPCGRCPVFGLCEEGGPVSAGNCEYFEEWLKF